MPNSSATPSTPPAPGPSAPDAVAAAAARPDPTRPAEPRPAERRPPDARALGALRAALVGDVIPAGDPRYDAARRRWNAAMDDRPALIARCAGTADVAAAVRFAADHGYPVAVRGGGLGSVPVGPDALLVDLTAMRGVAVDPGRRTAAAEGGVPWRLFDAETARYGLAAPGCQYPDVGVAGYTLGGGYGWLARRYGAGCDALAQAEVVTAAGEVVVADARTHPDLFWGLRGGGGNFGVVTRLTLQLHPVATVVAGFAFFPVERAAEVLAFYRDWTHGKGGAAGVAETRTMPAELTTGLNVLVGGPDLPAPLANRPVVAVGVCWCGPVAAAERVLRPLRALRPAADAIAPTPYVALQHGGAAGLPPGLSNRWHADFVDDLPDAAVEALAAQAARLTGRPILLLHHYEGAVAAVEEDATAFGHRDAVYNCNVNVRWAAPGDGGAEGAAARAWGDGVRDAVRPFVTGGVYVNYLGTEGEARVRAAYDAPGGPAPKFERLRRLKRAWDPDDRFATTQHIPPADRTPPDPRTAAAPSPASVDVRA